MSRRASSSADERKPRHPEAHLIPDLVNSVIAEHTANCIEYAQKRVVEAIEAYGEAFRKDQLARENCVQKQDFVQPVHHDVATSEHTPDDVIHDPSLAAQHQMVAKLKRTKPSTKSKNRARPIPLTYTNTVPKYDAWIPVRTNFWAGKQLHIEPYMPFLGDQDVDCELAFEVYEDMAVDAGKEVDVSDGEVDDDGHLILPKNDIERCIYHSIPQVRWRESCRMSILKVLDKFTKLDEPMWRMLGSALGIRDPRRLRAVARVAQERRMEKRSTQTRRRREREMSAAVDHMMDNPTDEEMPAAEEWTASANCLKHFCFTCQHFPCPQHANLDVEPVLPIEDRAAQSRAEELQSASSKPCSKTCFLSVSEERKGQLCDSPDWTAEEILLLREAVPMFGMDPCSLSVVVGSQTCWQVWMKLNDPIEADIAHDEINRARRPQRIEVVKKKAGAKPDKKSKAKISSKTVVEPADTSTNIDQDFVPCHHNGPCTIDNCMCVKKEMHCEATCGCNFGRYAECGLTGGVVWQRPRLEAVHRGVARECWNRHMGCRCESGHCDDNSCTCHDMNRACNPDFCSCDCSVLPGHTSVGKRRCRNVPASIAKHKRTFVGKSDVHGFGLFAGERFERGDLVGVYSGQLIDTRLADMIGRLYDATDRTYIFNVTESLVIDGGMLGSKAKFCNHTKPGCGENCASRLVRVRGDAYVALFTKRRVEPGEEFLFDYRFTGEVPLWAIDEPDVQVV